MTTRIKLRRDTAANWTLNNPILAAGEPGLETDSTKLKYGDGNTAWNSLGYATGGITAREQIGYFTAASPEIVDDYSMWFETVVADPDGNAYFVGSESNTYWTRVVKVDTEGAVVWQKEITWADGDEGMAASAVYNTATDQLVIVSEVEKSVVAGDQQVDGFAVITVNAVTGAIVGNPTVVRDDIISDGSQNGWMRPTDIILTAAGTPVVSGRKNGNATLFPVTTQTGSTTDTIFVDSAQFLNRYPDTNDWSITGTNIGIPLDINNVNYYDNLPATPLIASGSNATISAEWRMKGTEIWFPDYPGTFGVWVYQGGSGFTVGDTLSLPAENYGGATTGTITVNAVDGGGGISVWSFTGTFNTSTIKLGTAGYNFDFGTTGSWTVQNFDTDAFVWTPDWCVNFGAGDTDEAHALAKDSQGNIYAAARSYDYSIGGENRGLLVKISSTGTLIWNKNFDSVTWNNHNEGYTGVAVDSNDDIIVVQDEQITKVSGAGTVVWQKEVEPGMPFGMFNACVDVDSDDNIYWIAEYSYMGGPADNFLIIKFDADGNVVWQREAGTPLKKILTGMMDIKS